MRCEVSNDIGRLRASDAWNKTTIFTTSHEIATMDEGVAGNRYPEVR